jgi:adenylate cyclase
MPVEIERKFLITSNTWRQMAHQSIEIRQGYLCKDIERTVRVRTWGTEGKLTVKGKSINGVRAEYEYTIPVEEAVEMLENLCLSGVVHKTRHLIASDKYTWEIDEFLDHNRGLVLAEVELPAIDASIQIPEWVGKEVTNDHRFQNSHLASHRIDIQSEYNRH